MPNEGTMGTNAPIPSTRQRFAREVGQPEKELDLARAALFVAQAEYPQLALEPYLIRLDAMAEEVRDGLNGETAPPVVITEISKVLFERHGMRGNRDHYYDPKNSFLNDVLDRGLGIPLTLGIVYLEVAWRVGLNLEGVAFPGHFLLRQPGEAVSLLIDPYHQGVVRFEDQAQEVLDQQYGGMVRLQDAHLNRASKRDMIVRLLVNLKSIYQKDGDHSRALQVVELLLAVHPTAPSEIRDRGVLLARLGRPEEALAQLETYLTFAPDAGDVMQVEALVRDIRRGDGPPFKYP